MKISGSAGRHPQPLPRDRKLIKVTGDKWNSPRSRKELQGRRLVAESGGIHGTEQIRLEELGLLQALYSERFIAASDLHQSGRIVRTDGAKALDELVRSLTQTGGTPQRRDLQRARTPGLDSNRRKPFVEYIIPKDFVDSPYLTLTILTWNPDLFGGDDWLTDQIQDFEDGWEVEHLEHWPPPRRLAAGRLRSASSAEGERGIVAIGTVMSEIHQSTSWKPGAGPANYVRVAWDHIAELDDRLPIETLLEHIPEAKWNLYQSGRQFTGDVADNIWLACYDWWGLLDEEDLS